MLRSQALTALFNENTDTTAPAIFLSTLSGHLIGTSSTSSDLLPPLLRKASILASNTFAYHVEQARAQSSNSGSAIDGASNFSAHGSRMPSRGAASRTSERMGSANAVSLGSGSASGSSVVRGMGSVATARLWRSYASVQPLVVLSRSEWRDENGDANGSAVDVVNGVETGVRRLVVELPVGVRSSETVEDRSVSRICAIESIGQGLLVGVVGAEWESPVTSGENKGEHGGQDEHEEGSIPSQSSVGSTHSSEYRAREKARLVRLLDVKTEALAEFVRGEFEGFRMPKVDL